MSEMGATGISAPPLLEYYVVMDGCSGQYFGVIFASEPVAKELMAILVEQETARALAVVKVMLPAQPSERLVASFNSEVVRSLDLSEYWN